MIFKLLDLVLRRKLFKLFFAKFMMRYMIRIWLIMLGSKRRKRRPCGRRWGISWWRSLVEKRRTIALTSEGLVRVSEDVENLVIVPHWRSRDIVHLPTPELVGVLIASVGDVTRLRVKLRAAPFLRVTDVVTAACLALKIKVLCREVNTPCW